MTIYGCSLWAVRQELARVLVFHRVNARAPARFSFALFGEVL